MKQEKAGLGEQALNKIAEIALTSQLEEVERLEVQIKTDLSKLAHGEVDSIAININGLLMQHDLVVEELQLQINRVVVKPRSAIFGKIKLTQPSTGTVRIAINEDNLTRAFNTEYFHKHLHQIQTGVEDKPVIRIKPVKCSLLADGSIAFSSEQILGKIGEAQPFAFTGTPRIGTDGKEIVLQNGHYEGKELPPELTAALVAQLSKVLSVRNFEQRECHCKFSRLMW